MRTWASAVRLAVFLSVCSAAYSQPPAKSHPSQRIVVKIRNGNTGFPVWLASPYVFVGDTDPQKFIDSYRRTKLWGDAHVDVDGATPPEVKVWVDFIHRDCRYASVDRNYQTDPARTTYDIAKILAEGIVAPNLCSAKTQRPEPGVLTIYVLPATFKELWNY